MRLLVLLLTPFLLAAQTETTYEGLPAIELANDDITLTVTIRGGAMTGIVLNDDAEKMNPLWNPMRMSRERGRERPNTMFGHFICVDGFGPASEEENAAGMPFHGEAYLKDLEVLESAKSGDTLTLRLRTEMPLAHEVVTRTYQIVDGEQVVYVTSELENQLAFDRPVCWGEHATISSPFLAPEVTVVDLSAARSQVKPVAEGGRGRHRLASGQDFTWPMAPAFEGGLANVRSVPANPGSMDHTTSRMDPNRKVQFITAMNLEKRLMIGYLFRTEDFPWVQTWDSYMLANALTRGLEFATQPYDVPRREAIGLGKMFDTPTYRWLLAKSKISTSFLMFYTRVPEGFDQVDDVRMEDGQIIIENRGAGKTITLKAQRPL